jgi:peptidoglycan/xylan/chitin deacetylase (PgdA/CDA1 family)
VSHINKTIIWAGLETLYFSGAHHLARRFLSGVGTILTFHRVRPPLKDAFQPNRLLEIAPAFLDELVARIKDSGIDIVSMDEVHRRLTEGGASNRFVALTFDDGYRDNLEFAYPILKRHAVPFMLYVPAAFAEGRGELWWVWLERAVAARDSIDVAIAGETRHFDCATPAAKDETFAAIYWALRGLGDEGELRRICRDLAIGAGLDADAVCRELCMGWDEIQKLAADPLVTIGNHTDTHPMLAKASEEAVRRELRIGSERIEARLGTRPRHVSYPVGDPGSAGRREFDIAAEFGFATGVTTRPGVLFPEHRQHLTALPRISVNGEFQRLRYLDVLLSGAPTALMNRFRRVDAA